MLEYVNPVTVFNTIRILFKLLGFYKGLTTELYVADIIAGWVLVFLTEPPPINNLTQLLLLPFLTLFYMDWLTLVFLPYSHPETLRKQQDKAFKAIILQAIQRASIK